MAVAWNKMTKEDVITKSLNLNPDLTIHDVFYENKNWKIIIDCPICKKKRENPTTIAMIKKGSLACKKCRGKKISETKLKADEKDSFYCNDKHDRVKFWDYEKNEKDPREVSKSSHKKYWFCCERGHSFKQSLSDVNAGKWCIHCANMQKESKMASILKQVLKHEFESTIWEYDIGFKGFKGGTSKYDIYVPELNLLIECQSNYHDRTKGKDELKKEYAINNGYDFIELDCRDFTPLECIQLFFPYIDEIPDYVDLDLNTSINWNIQEVQSMISNTDYTLPEICNILNIKISSLHYRISTGEIILPDDKKIEEPIVVLNLNGEYITQYESIAEACRQNINFRSSDICSCCKGKQKTHRGYLFKYLKEYEELKDEFGNIQVCEDYHKIDKNSHKKKVLQLSKDGKFIKEFNSISDVEKELGYLTSNISLCCNRGCRTSNGYIWLFENDYNEYKKGKFDLNKINKKKKQQTKTL